MRRRPDPSEFARLASPLAQGFDAVWRRMHWWVALMAVLYACSGITVVPPDEVAIIERWGRVVGDTPALQVHGPGLLFAFPRPMDQVIRVSTKQVRQLRIDTLAPSHNADVSGNTLDPLAVGYALTGDQNIVHVEMIARYRVRDPSAWAFYGPPSEDILRAEITSAMVRSLGEMAVDKVLAQGRKHLIEQVTARSQAGLDAAHSGLELVALELTQLSPPAALAADFDAVQSAYIGAETVRRDAQAFAQQVVPKAHAVADAAVRTAQADSAQARAEARGQAAAFLALDKQYRANPGVVRERLYRDAIDGVFGAAGSVRWLPPASGGRQGIRVMLDSQWPFVNGTNKPAPGPSAEPQATPSPDDAAPPDTSASPDLSPAPNASASPDAQKPGSPGDD